MTPENEDSPKEASLGQLPNELKCAIFNQLGKKDHLALCLVSKSVSPSATVCLYESFDNCNDQASLPTLTPGRSALSQLICTLTKRPELALRFKQLRFTRSRAKELLTKEELQYCLRVLRTCYSKETASLITNFKGKRFALLQFLKRCLHEGDPRAIIVVLLLAAKKFEHIFISVSWFTDSAEYKQDPQWKALDEIVRTLVGMYAGDGAGTFEKLSSAHFHISGDGPAKDLWQNAQKTCCMPTVDYLSLSAHISGGDWYDAETIKSSPNLKSLSIKTCGVHQKYLICALRLSSDLKSFDMSLGNSSMTPSEATDALLYHKHSLTSVKLIALATYKSVRPPISSMREFVHLKNLTIDIFFLTTGFSVMDLWKSANDLERSLAELLPLGLENLTLCTNHHLYNYVEIFGSAMLAVPQFLKGFQVQFDVHERLRACDFGNHISTLAYISQKHGSSFTTTHFNLKIDSQAHIITADLRRCEDTMKWLRGARSVDQVQLTSADLKAPAITGSKYHASSKIKDYIENSAIKDEVHELWNRMLALRLPRYNIEVSN